MEFAVVATIVSCCSQIPQAVKSCTRKKTKDIAVVSTLLLILSSTLWSISSAITFNIPLLINCIIIGVCQCIIFYIYCKQDKPKTVFTQTNDITTL